MKKSVIALLLLAVLIIIVSPGIVGKLAEDSVGENLNWAAEESGELTVSSAVFDRGWFSSEGQFRVELGEGSIRTALGATAGELPVLIIDTHIDHGLIPVSSLGRDEGSLAPGLGSAVSTLSVEYGDGESFKIPGVIYSQLGLAGDLDSKYSVEAGSQSIDDGEVTWQPTTIHIAASSRTGDFEFSGDIGAMTFGNDQQIVSIDGLTFVGQQSTTSYGFRVGDVDLKMGAMTSNVGGALAGGLQSMTLKASSSVDNGVAAAAMRLALNGQTVPGFGDISVIADMDFNGLDAVALGALSKRLDDQSSTQNPSMVLLEAADEFKDLLAAGLNITVDQFDVWMPVGTVQMKMTVDIPAADPASFEWTSLLLSAVASLDIIVPDELVQLATSMNPQAGAMIGMGYLKKEGDVYIVDADFKQGLLTINGAPVPIPLGAFQ